MKNKLPANFKISTDKTDLDLDVIYTFLSNTYWAKERSRAAVKESIKHSHCFGVYLKKQQIGFARVISDQVVFAYIMDVFIIKEQQGKGYSKLLMNNILKEADFKNVKKWLLITKDAHGLYQQFGFAELKQPERFMERHCT